MSRWDHQASGEDNEEHQARYREHLAAARAHKMTLEEKEAQRRSFAYGNIHIDNPNVTREMIAAAAERQLVMLTLPEKHDKLVSWMRRICKATDERENIVNVEEWQEELERLT